MIIMDLKMNNFFAFRNFHINMSYPKKIVDSSIEDEFLKARPNFRYKKVNIIMGANATGKTSIGKMLMLIFNAINKKDFTSIIEKISDKKQEATFTMDFVANSYKMYRIDVKFIPKADSNFQDSNTDIQIKIDAVDINMKDNYESCAIKLDSILSKKYNNNYAEELKKIESFGWFFSYPMDTAEDIPVLRCSQNENYLKILDYTLRALDPSIKKVQQIEAVDNTYVIRMDNQDIVIQDGQVVKESILSSGTKAGIDIAYMLASISCREHGFYYCDEKFSYVHSDIEKAFLSVMIDCLQANDQLFFTTHNTDILDLALPKHTFTFLKKDTDDNEPIKCISASHFLKRNTDSLRNAVDNDLFSISPNVELIYEIKNF